MKTKSKYGPRKRGDVRDDGYVFWSYREGNEIWVNPKRFAQMQERSLACAAAHARLYSAKRTRAVRAWRRKHRNRVKQQTAQNTANQKAAKRWSATIAYYHKMLDCLNNPIIRRCRSDKDNTGAFVRLYTTKRRAKMVYKFLTSQINEKVFVNV